jgi:serine/threonine protein phosphatase PrpC
MDALPLRAHHTDSVYQQAAQRLAHEAYVRGSSDNIGVVVVDLQEKQT